MAVRRELDDQQGVINLQHLLHEMEQRADVASRHNFMEYACPSCCWCWYEKEKNEATSTFESFRLLTFPPQDQWDDRGRDHLDPAGVAADRETLHSEAGEAFRYAQRLVAHRTPMKFHHISREPVDRAVDVIWAVVQKYYSFLAAEALTPRRPRPRTGWNKGLRQTLLSRRGNAIKSHGTA